MTKMCRALFKYLNERKKGWNNWLTTWYFTQIRSPVGKGDVLGCIPSNRSRVQRWSTHQNVLAVKFFVLFPNLEPSFIVIVIVWLLLTHFYCWSLTKNMIRRAPMSTTRRSFDYGSEGTEDTSFVQCINGQEPQIHEF